MIFSNLEGRVRHASQGQLSWIRSRKLRSGVEVGSQKKQERQHFRMPICTEEPDAYGTKRDTGWQAGGKSRWSHRVRTTQDECRSMVQMPEETVLSRAALYSGAGWSLHKGTLVECPCPGITPAMVILEMRLNTSQSSGICGGGRTVGRGFPAELLPCQPHSVLGKGTILSPPLCSPESWASERMQGDCTAPRSPDKLPGPHSGRHHACAVTLLVSAARSDPTSAHELLTSRSPRDLPGPLVVLFLLKLLPSQR